MAESSSVASQHPLEETGKLPLASPVVRDGCVALSDYDGLLKLMRNRSAESIRDDPRTAALLDALENQRPHPDAGLAAPPSLLLSPIIALSKYPYKFVSKDVGQRIAKGFFDDGKFWNRMWHIFYVYPPKSVSEKPVLFVPFSQFNDLLSEINKAFGMGLVLSARDREVGLAMEMPDHPDLVARFLGSSKTKDGFERLKTRVPERLESTANHSMTVRATFTDLMVKATAIVKGGPGSADALKAAKKTREQMVKRREHRTHLKESERLLGLRPSIHVKQAPALDLSWEEEVQMREQQSALAQASLHPTPIDITKPPPFAFEENVVFISIDLEWWERDSRVITEVGIATLDTTDLQGHAPGKNGQLWESKIRARHFRIFEHRNYRNSIAEGDPERFDFGETTMISKADAPKAIASCFRPPYSASSASELASITPRRVVLVGHDLAGDFRALRTLGYDVSNLATLHRTVLDTSSLYRALTHETNNPSLGKIISEFEFVPWNLHNAGNDAFYTMQAMIAIAICAATEKRENRAASDASKGTGYSSEEEW